MNEDHRKYFIFHNGVYVGKKKWDETQKEFQSGHLVAYDLCFNDLTIIYERKE